MPQIRSIFSRKYTPLNKIYISENRLLSNYRFLSSLKKDVSIVPILKSNAYGHGIVQIGKVVDTMDTPFIGVDSMHEGYALLKAGVKTPILIMGAINPENLKVKKLPFSYIVYSLETVSQIAKYQKGARVHIEVDTGMSRLGVQMEDLAEFFEKIQEIPNIQIEGFMSHFAEAENAHASITKKQIKNMNEAYSLLRDSGLNPPFIHFEASAALLNADVRRQLPMTTVARIGKAFYGIEPSEKDHKLKPVLKLDTEIVQIKTLKKGDQVGYGATFTAQRDLKLAILPLGYNDGLDRRLSNIGSAIVKNVVCPIVGRISMNMATIDVSLVPHVKVGSQVTVISDERGDPNSIENIAKKCKTISHELLIHIDSTTKRIVV